MVVLAINRADGVFLGAPDGDTGIQPEDTLILYGRSEDLTRLDERRKGYSGDREHDAAVDKQKKVVDEEKQEDWEASRKSSARENN